MDVHVCTAGDRMQHVHAKAGHADRRSDEARVFVDGGEGVKADLTRVGVKELSAIWAPIADRAAARALGDPRGTWPVHIDTDHEVPFRHLHRLAVELRRLGVKQVRLDARPLPGWRTDE